MQNFAPKNSFSSTNATHSHHLTEQFKIGFRLSPTTALAPTHTTRIHDNNVHCNFSIPYAHATKYTPSGARFFKAVWQPNDKYLKPTFVSAIFKAV